MDRQRLSTAARPKNRADYRGNGRADKPGFTSLAGSQADVVAAMLHQKPGPRVWPETGSRFYVRREPGRPLSASAASRIHAAIVDWIKCERFSPPTPLLGLL